MSLDDDIRTLAKAPLLTDIGREALRLIAFSAEGMDLERGQRLFAKGEPAEGAFTVVRGRIRLGNDGDRLERVVGPGSLIGELALFIPTERPCAAIALDPSRLLAIPRPLFRRMLGEFPHIAGQLRERLAARLRDEQAALERVRATLDSLDSRRGS